jgi:hypothetical protein
MMEDDHIPFLGYGKSTNRFYIVTPLAGLGYETQRRYFYCKKKRFSMVSTNN